MIDGPYIFWQSEEEYLELNFELQGNEWEEKKEVKNIHQFPAVEVNLMDRTLSIPLKKEFSPESAGFKHARKIIAFGDIHGEFVHLVNMLIASQIIDENFNWIFGEGHLVFCGDIFDRGSQVTECLWLIYFLEKQAEQSGGFVHYLLGNHEVMSLTGDHRYLHQKYKKLASLLNLEYQDLFNLESELGRWLRNKNTLIAINDLLFVHAGISPDFQIKISEVNRIVQEYLAGDDRHFYFVNDPHSPLWYRGYMYSWQGSKQASQAEIEEILHIFAAKKIVFAHTEVESITSLFQDMAIAIDVSFKKFPQALLIVGNEFYKIDKSGIRKKLI